MIKSSFRFLALLAMTVFASCKGDFEIIQKRPEPASTASRYVRASDDPRLADGLAKALSIVTSGRSRTNTDGLDTLIHSLALMHVDTNTRVVSYAYFLGDDGHSLKNLVLSELDGAWLGAFYTWVRPNESNQASVLQVESLDGNMVAELVSELGGGVWPALSANSPFGTSAIIAPTWNIPRPMWKWN
jgi:hypothetical protein